jgi:hypothetical protein
LEDFRLRLDALDERRDRPIARESRNARSNNEITQSERDWGFAKRALARGDAAEEVIRRIADYRAGDKHDPTYYARYTVEKAQAALHREPGASSTPEEAIEGSNCGPVDATAEHETPR